MGIEWQEGSVCYADGEQWHSEKESSNALTFGNFQLNFNDFQLNEPRQGDYIPKSELDTEHKYNDVVEEFGLFGFVFCGGAISEYNKLNKHDFITCCDDGLWQTSSDRWNKRPLTYNQLMAIGKLKRLEIEREKREAREVFVEALDETVAHAEKLEDAVNKPSHYQFFEGVEVIEIIASSMTREQFKGYCLGNRIKYRLRAGNKDKLEQEIAKSDKYVELYDEHKHLCK